MSGIDISFWPKLNQSLDAHRTSLMSIGSLQDVRAWCRYLTYSWQWCWRHQAIVRTSVLTWPNLDSQVFAGYRLIPQWYVKIRIICIHECKTTFQTSFFLFAYSQVQYTNNSLQRKTSTSVIRGANICWYSYEMVPSERKLHPTS